MIKILGSAPGSGVTGNAFTGIEVASSSSAQIGGVVSNNGIGVYIGPLSFAQRSGTIGFSGNGADVQCEHSTSINRLGVVCSP
jgi:hypothetical protein